MGAPLPHGDPLSIGLVVARHRRRVDPPLEGFADVGGGHAAHYGFDAVAFPVSEQSPSRSV